MSEPLYVLASASPRRRELLDLVGIRHSVEPPDIDESVGAGESPIAYVERLAREKASKVAARHPDAIVVAADTTVVLGELMLAKPESVEEAVGMLTTLSGNTHTVLTGMACMRGGALVSCVESVEVTFRELSLREIGEYVATGEPMDKAGAYGIQGFGATIVRRIDGDYFAVMGLSLVRLVELLERLGIAYHFGNAMPNQVSTP
jgi:septum formation protein